MRHFALTAIGPERPGIVAAVSAALLAHAGNVEDSRMAILRGRFTLMLVAALPDDADPAGLRRSLEEARERLALDALSLEEVTTQEGADPHPSHVVSVHGADHPGIVHAVTAALAVRGTTITDLTTRLVAADDVPLYVMLLEIALPGDLPPEAIASALGAVGAEEGVDVTVRPLDDDAL